MKNVMTWIIGITLTLGMIALSVLGQVSGARDIGEKGDIEQTKVSMMISDSNIVTGNTVKNYIKQDEIDVTVDDETSPDADKIVDGALYSMEKTYDANGILTEVKFEQIDLSRSDS
ncbi:MAG: hypothetical protein MJA82_08440 [Clostridia bacterium]|nr:hypothetical protein [Clostridia bacterium]